MCKREEREAISHNKDYDEREMKAGMRCEHEKSAGNKHKRAQRKEDKETEEPLLLLYVHE